MQPVVQYTPKTQKPASQVVPTGTLSQRKLKVRNIDANTVTIADLQVSRDNQVLFVWLTLWFVCFVIAVETFLQVWSFDLVRLRQKYAWTVPRLSYAHLCEGHVRSGRYQAVQ